MAKTDIEVTFRLLTVNPDSLFLLGCRFNGAYFVDRCLPMGCSISCAYFELFSSFLKWVVRVHTGFNYVVYYLDDFLCVGPCGSRVCELLLHSLTRIFAQFGVPISPDKT